jgi:hypothetical protein
MRLIVAGLVLLCMGIAWLGPPHTGRATLSSEYGSKLAKNAYLSSFGMGVSRRGRNPSDSADRPLANDDSCFCSCAHLIARAHFALDFSINCAPVEAQPLYVALVRMELESAKRTVRSDPEDQILTAKLQ